MKPVIVSTCMNRNEYLLASLPGWLATGAPVVLVDWSSEVPIRQTLGETAERLNLVEVPGKMFFHNSLSRNLGIRAALRTCPGATHLLALDCDVILRDWGWFLSRDGTGDAFYRGDLRYQGFGVSKTLRHFSRWFGDGTWTNCGLIGSFLAPMPLVRLVNGYDERMSGYGRFDDDLYARMAALPGVREERIPRHALFHQPHAARMDHYERRQRDPRGEASGAGNGPWGARFAQERQFCFLNGEPMYL